MLDQPQNSVHYAQRILATTDPIGFNIKIEQNTRKRSPVHPMDRLSRMNFAIPPDLGLNKVISSSQLTHKRA